MTTLACDHRVINLSVREYTVRPFSFYEKKVKLVESALILFLTYLVGYQLPDPIKLLHVPLTIDCYVIQFTFYLDKTFIEYGVKFLEYALGQPSCLA